MESLIGMFTGGGGGSSGGFSAFSENEAQRHYEDVYLSERPHHESSLTHEAIAAAAGFAAMHAYESHLRATGQPVSHGKMKEILAAIAAAEVDKLAETKGLDWLDRERAQRYAAHQAHALAEQRYGPGDSGWDYSQQQQQYQGQGYPNQNQYQYEGQGGYGGGYGGGGGGQGGWGGGPSREYDFGGGAPFGGPGCPSQGWYEERYQRPGLYGGGYGGGGGGPPPPQYYGGGPQEYVGEQEYRGEPGYGYGGRPGYEGGGGYGGGY